MRRPDAPDPPPYAWLDDPAQPYGPVSIAMTVGLGSMLSLIGAFSLALGVFGGHHGQTARVVAGVAFVLMGGLIVRMGIARRSWRLRNPGVDPLDAAVRAGANVGSAFGDQSVVGRAGRYLLVVVCALVTLIMALALVRAISGATPTSVGGMAAIVCIGAFSAIVGVVGAGRSRR